MSISLLRVWEAGIELTGTEVKSLRQGQVNLKDSWCSIDRSELFIKGMHISPYEKGNIFNRDPIRVRKLLIHKKEINRLLGKVKQDGLTLIPLSIYFKGSNRKDSTRTFAKEKSYTTNVKTPLKRMRNVRLRERSKAVINRGRKGFDGDFEP